MANDNYTGVTTGTIATACSLAALDAILETPDIACVKVETPKKTLDIIIDECKRISDAEAYAVAHKNPYNDPDVTVDLAIVSTVELLDRTDEEDNVIITGGKGVGKMSMFTNGVGRPSNETIRKRNIFKGICVLLVIVIIALVAYILNDNYFYS